MKKTVLIAILTLIVGIGVGVLGYMSLGIVSTDAPYRTTMNAVADTATSSTTVPEGIDITTEDTEIETLDVADNFTLLAVSNRVLIGLMEGDFETVASYVHLEKGVTFTPYSTVNPDVDLCFTPSQIAALASDETVYIWGVWDGLGEPISLSVTDYFERFVLSQDFTQAPNIGIDTVQSSGNSIENVSAIFDQGRYVEYYYPQIDPQFAGLDWCALKLVFEVYNNQWALVGIIHSQWTV